MSNYQESVLRSIAKDNADYRAKALAKWGDKLIAYVAHSRVGTANSQYHVTEFFGDLKKRKFGFGHRLAREISLVDYVKATFPEGGTIKFHDAKFLADDGDGCHYIPAWKEGCTTHYLYAIIGK